MCGSDSSEEADALSTNQYHRQVCHILLRAPTLLSLGKRLTIFNAKKDSSS